MKTDQLPRGSRECLALSACLLAPLVLYLFLIYQTMTLFWNDAHIRWALRDRILLEEWLPGVQVFVFWIARFTSNFEHLQVFLSFLALCVLVCFYNLARHLFSHRTGLITVLFVGFNSLFATFAIMPYSVILFVGVVALIFVLLASSPFSKQFYLGVLLVNLACLISYEGWFLAAVLVIYTTFRLFRKMEGRFPLWQGLQVVVLFSIVPIVWLMTGPNSSQGPMERLNSIFQFIVASDTLQISDHITAHLNIFHLVEFSIQFIRTLIITMRPDFLVLALLGLWSALRDPARRELHWLIILFLVLDLCLLAFVQPWGFGSLRQPFVIQSFLMVYAAHGMLVLVSWIGKRFAPWLSRSPFFNANGRLAGTSVLLLTASLFFTTQVFARRASQTYVTPYTIAKWLDGRVTDDDAILVLDDSNDYPYILAAYMDRPVGYILDDRWEDDLILRDLTGSQNAYVVALYRSRNGLTSTEARVLNELESGFITTNLFVLEGVNIWYGPAAQIPYP